MKITPLVACLGLFLTVPLFAADDLVAERRTVLEKIITVLESRHAVGLDPVAELHNAKLALYSFERDTALEPEKQILWQQKIVQLHEAELAQLKAQASAGLGNDLDILHSRERLLAARIMLEKLQKH